MDRVGSITKSSRSSCLASSSKDSAQGKFFFEVINHHWSAEYNFAFQGHPLIDLH